MQGQPYIELDSWVRSEYLADRVLRDRQQCHEDRGKLFLVPEGINFIFLGSSEVGMR